MGKLLLADSNVVGVSVDARRRFAANTTNFDVHLPNLRVEDVESESE